MQKLEMYKGTTLVWLMVGSGWCTEKVKPMRAANNEVSAQRRPMARRNLSTLSSAKGLVRASAVFWSVGQ